MRISTSMTYDNSLKYMTRLQSEINRTTIQMATQQRINCPSDDPYGSEVALTNSTLISQLTQYQSNVDTAKGWLSLADDTLGDASTALTSLIELAEQAATGTLTDANREAIAEEARGLYEQLITYANTQYNGQSIFAGRDSGGTAYTAIEQAVTAARSSLGTVQTVELWMCETKAPNGYRILQAPQKVTLQIVKATADAKVTTTVVGGPLSLVNTRDGQEGGGNFALPNTGGTGALVFGIVGAVLIAAAVTYFVRSRKRDQHDQS